MARTRAAAFVFAGVLALGSPVARDAGAKETVKGYEEDARFLLDELPKRARPLLQSKGIDRTKATKDVRADAKRVEDDAGYVRLVSRILARLRDGHAGIVRLAPDFEASVGKSRKEEARGRRWTGPRVHVLVVGKKVLVGNAFGSAAEQGVKVGMEVVAIDDVPALPWLEKKAHEMRDEQGFSTDHEALHAAGHWGLAAWEGTPVTFLLSTKRERRSVTLVREGGPNFVPVGPVHPPQGLERVGRQSYGKTPRGFGYVHVRDVPDDLPGQVDSMLQKIGDVDGLVLDMRANGGGGCDHDAVFGRFLATGSKWRQYGSQGARPFAGPLVVIVDAGVRSAGETVAAMLKEDGRAFVIGPEPTAGTSSQKTTIDVPSGRLTVRVSVASNMKRVNGGRGIEGIGVPPNETVPYVAEELLEGVDTQIRRAEELLRDGFPDGSVAYRPPPSAAK